MSNLNLAFTVFETNEQESFEVLASFMSGRGASADVTSERARTKTAVPQVPLHYPFTVNAGDKADDKCTKATLAPQSDGRLIVANGHLLELVDAQNQSQQ